MSRVFSGGRKTHCLSSTRDQNLRPNPVGLELESKGFGGQAWGDDSGVKTGGQRDQQEEIKTDPANPDDIVATPSNQETVVEIQTPLRKLKFKALTQREPGLQRN